MVIVKTEGLGMETVPFMLFPNGSGSTVMW